MEKTRIYGRKHNICAENTRNFYDERAKKIEEAKMRQIQTGKNPLEFA